MLVLWTNCSTFSGRPSEWCVLRSVAVARTHGRVAGRRVSHYPLLFFGSCGPCQDFHPEDLQATIETFTDQCVQDLATPNEINAMLSQCVGIIAPTNNVDAPSTLTTVCVHVLLRLKTQSMTAYGMHDSISSWALGHFHRCSGTGLAAWFAKIRASLHDSTARIDSLARACLVPCDDRKATLLTWVGVVVDYLGAWLYVRIVLQVGLPTNCRAAERAAAKSKVLALLLHSSDGTSSASAVSSLLRLSSQILCHDRNEAHEVRSCLRLLPQSGKVRMTKLH